MLSRPNFARGINREMDVAGFDLGGARPIGGVAGFRASLVALVLQDRPDHARQKHHKQNPLFHAQSVGTVSVRPTPRNK